MRIAAAKFAGVVVIASMALAGCSVSPSPSASTSPSPSTSASTSTGPITQAQAAGDYASLQYLIEEEKLAHDVYLALYQQWGSKVFGNILESESTHQQRVEDLLVSFAVADPRDSQLGVFNDPELQALYDELMIKGLMSVQDAFEVGVLIEERDIADIQVQLSTTDDPEIKLVLESLLKGSENHLAAFEKQIG